MAERIELGYKRLFEVRLLHHYWLDEGAVLFDELPAASREKRLLTYDRRPFLAVIPTPGTATALQGLSAVFKNTALGWVVAIPKDAPVPADARFTFILQVLQGDFFNYTALTLPTQQIFEFYHPPTKKLFRYQENIPVFSNLTGAARGEGAARALFLSKEIPLLTATDKVEALVVSGTALVQLTADQPGADSRQLNARVTDMPVFVHQDDVPLLVPPPGLTGTPPARGIALTDDLPEPLFALVQIAAVHPTDAGFSCTTGGLAKEFPPIFQIRFKNRSSVWRYRNKNNPALPPTDAGLFPLSWYGNAGPKQKPSTGEVKAEKTGTRITQLISEIFE